MAMGLWPKNRLKIGSTHDGGADLGRPDSDHDRLGRRARYEAHPPQRGFRRALAGAIARAIAALLAGLAHTDAHLRCSGSLPGPGLPACTWRCECTESSLGSWSTPPEYLSLG